MSFGFGTTPTLYDPIHTLLAKILIAINSGISISISGVTSIYNSNVDPNGVQSATGPALCIGYGAMDGYLWTKNTAGASNSDWVAVTLP